jgi:hypothetical protein
MVAPWLANLATIGEAAAFTASDYKALVCVFLFGGNDYANTVVTYDTDSYAKYYAIRAAGSGGNTSGVALSQASLAATELKPTQAVECGPTGRTLNAGAIQQQRSTKISVAAQALFSQRSAVCVAIVFT